MSSLAVVAAVPTKCLCVKGFDKHSKGFGGSDLLERAVIQLVD